MTTRILFVCLGNICRSPAAEAVFRKMAGDKAEADSAGTAGWHVGQPPYDPMQQVAGARGYDLSNLRGRKFHPKDFDRFDLILAMDADNIAGIERQRPAGAETPVKLLTDFGQAGAVHVPDPYYTRDFNEALDLIEDACKGLIRAL